MKQIKEKLIISFTAIFAIISIIVFLNVTLNNTTLFNVTKPIVIFMFLAIYIALISTTYFLSKKYKKIFKNEKIIIALIFIAIIIFQIIYSYNCYTEYGWDCGHVLKNAKNLSQNEIEFDANYYMQYYNNIYVMLFFNIIYEICTILHIGNFLYATILINIIIVDLSMFILYLVSKKIFGKNGGIASMAFSIPLLGMLPWIIVPYTDTLSMIFPILVFYLYLLMKENIDSNKKYILSILLGGILILGIFIKPTVIIVGIAIIIAEILNLKVTKEKIKETLKIVICILIGIVSVFGIANAYKDYKIGKFLSKEKIYELEIPMTHFMMMGLKTTETADGKFAYGVFDQEDAANTASHIGKDEKTKYNIEEIKVRLQKMGIKGYISFAYKKLNWILCDGSFFYGGEGNFFASEPFAEGKLAGMVQSFSYLTSENYYIYQSFMQAIWIIVQVFLVISIVAIKDNWKDKNILIVRLTITGICMFIVLFEGRSRYLINHLPFFILLATSGLINIKYFKTIINNLKLRSGI